MNHYDHLTDRQLLAVVASDVADMKRDLRGNGQEGLIARVARLEAHSHKGPEGPPTTTSWTNNTLTRVAVVFGTALAAAGVAVWQTLL